MPSPGRIRPTGHGSHIPAVSRSAPAAPADPRRSRGPCGDAGRPRRTPSDLAANAPAATPGLARLDRHDVAAGPERVRRAGHRLDRDRPAVALADQRVTAVDLPPLERPVRP